MMLNKNFYFLTVLVVVIVEHTLHFGQKINFCVLDSRNRTYNNELFKGDMIRLKSEFSNLNYSNQQIKKSTLALKSLHFH